MATAQPGGPADRRYVRKAMKAPMLEAEHELNLARRWRENDDERAKKRTKGKEGGKKKK